MAPLLRHSDANGFGVGAAPRSHRFAPHRRWHLFCSGRKRLIAIAVALGISCLCLYHLITHGNQSFDDDFLNECWSPTLNSFGQLATAKQQKSENARILDLEKLRLSLLEDIRRMQGSRDLLRAHLEEMQRKSDEMHKEIEERGFELAHANILLDQARGAKASIVDDNRPHLKLPINIEPPGIGYTARLPPMNIKHRVVQNETVPCTVDTCLNLAKCPIIDGSMSIFAQWNVSVDSRIKSGILNTIHHSWQVVKSAKNACLSVIITDSNNHSFSTPEIGERTNKLIFVMSKNPANFHINSPEIVAAPAFALNSFRSNYDIIIPDISVAYWSHTVDDDWTKLVQILPLKRKYFASYAGHYIKSDNQKVENFAQTLIAVLNDLNTADGKSNSNDQIFVDFNCERHSEFDIAGTFAPCKQDIDERVLSLSQFAFILPHPVCFSDGGKSDCGVYSVAQNRRMILALKMGAIPVFIGIDESTLPFSNCGIDFASFSLRIPLARLFELPFILRSIAPWNAIELKRKGRLVYGNYFATIDGITNALLACISNRILLPSKSAQPVKRQYLLGNDKKGPSDDQTVLVYVDPRLNEETLGPIEGPVSSISFQHNFTNILSNRHMFWNTMYLPHVNIPSLPMFGLHGDPFFPADAKFSEDLQYLQFRPINNGRGGSGFPFRDDLGGNFPREQFTIVLLTYDRDATLNDTLAHFNHLPYLHKIIVVWNCNGVSGCRDVQMRANHSIWPKLHVPLVFVHHNYSNSLNNRFVPFDEIETDALLSLDDDMHLTHEEIIFAFRVWRENRDQLVGFPARFHAWEDGNWLYDSNHTCELSMILTGAAFLHRHYLYAYTYWMPSAIRAKVDELMNCEDLAMNFLISHTVRKPPIKVTSKWTFTWEDQPPALSNSETHFLERHECIRFFSKVYGYNPLLYTQFRADSVLFKTRLPSRHEKCFRNV